MRLISVDLIQTLCQSGDVGLFIVYVIRSQFPCFVCVFLNKINIQCIVVRVIAMLGIELRIDGSFSIIFQKSIND